MSTPITVVVSGTSSVVEVTTLGPQGAKGIELVETGKVDGSIVYYSSDERTFKADSVQTLLTLVDGGNF